MIVDPASAIAAPWIAIESASIPNNAGGSNTGKDSTGNSAPFPFAFEMMAAIAVIADAMQMLSIDTMIQ